MSSEALRWWRSARRRAPHASAALVLHELALEHRDGVSWQRASVRGIARELGMAKSTVHDALADLHAANLIEKCGRKVRLMLSLQVVETSGPPDTNCPAHRTRTSGPPDKTSGPPDTNKEREKAASRPQGAATPPFPSEPKGTSGKAEIDRPASPVNGADRPISAEIEESLRELRARAAAKGIGRIG